MLSTISDVISRRTIAILVSIASGVLVAFAVRINATLGAYVGPLESSFIVHLTGTAFALLFVGLRLQRPFWTKLRRGPKRELMGGVIGVVIVLLANLTVPQLGVALAVSLFIAADLFVSSLSDHFGWLGLRRIPVSPRRVIGLLIVFAGVLLVRFG